MTDAELRELDTWIAEHFMGWRRLNPDDSKAPSWEALPKPEELVTYPYARVITWETTSFNDAFQPSSLPAAFALVKRGIERRGWEWASAYERKSENLKEAYIFTVYTFADVYTAFDKLAGSEELAGCLAVKAAVESSVIPNNA